MEITVLEEKTIDTQAMIRLLTELKRKQPEGDIIHIADNASYNHSRELKQFLRKHKRIDIYYLPPYFPNLNPIDRLWLFFHRKILYDKYYETSKEFKTATLEHYLYNLANLVEKGIIAVLLSVVIIFLSLSIARSSTTAGNSHSADFLFFVMNRG